MVNVLPLQVIRVAYSYCQRWSAKFASPLESRVQARTKPLGIMTSTYRDGTFWLCRSKSTPSATVAQITVVPSFLTSHPFPCQRLCAS